MFTSRMEDQEAMDQQRMLNEEAVQEEQRRLLEEDSQTEQRTIQWIEIIQEIADLERERDKSKTSLGELVVKLSQDSILEF